ncbi:hypothetical protein [Piscinibacter sp.]|jgi:hypothetical protein|uniref:hypothetical protein n=1 Tax=Piscinibacter sp. TaxID=1903157 RepID=UPI0035594C60
MTKRKTSGNEAAPPGGRALGRARQFALSRGLPAPQVEGVDTAAAPAKPVTKKARKTTSKPPPR